MIVVSTHQNLVWDLVHKFKSLDLVSLLDWLCSPVFPFTFSRKSELAEWIKYLRVNSGFMSSNCASIGFCVSLHAGGRWLFGTLLSDVSSDFLMLGRDLFKMRIDCNLVIALQPFVAFESLEYSIRILQESAFTRTIHPKIKIK